MTAQVAVRVGDQLALRALQALLVRPEMQEGSQARVGAKVPNMGKLPIDVKILRQWEPFPAGAVAMYTGDAKSLDGRVYVRAPKLALGDRHIPSWAQECSGVIILNPHALKQSQGDVGAFHRAVISVIQITWKSLCKKGVTQ